MLQIRHKGHQISLAVDPTLLALDAPTFQANATVLGFIAGRVVALTNPDDVIALADGNESNGLVPIGFLINDMAGNFYENKPALASGYVGVSFGPSVVVTDQIVSGITINPGDRLYVGTSGNVGLLTNVAPSNARAIGIALAGASPASPSVLLAVL